MGADCTVFDYSDRQLETERAIAAREGYAVNIIKGDMAKRLPFEDESCEEAHIGNPKIGLGKFEQNTCPNALLPLPQ